MTRKEYQQKRKELGLCRDCSLPIAPTSKWYCEKHLLLKRNRQTKHIHRVMALGICTNCSSPTSPNSKWFCEDHLRKKAIVSINDRKKYKINKRCTRCAAPLDIDADAGHVDCINCRERGQNMMFVIHPFEKEVR